MFQLETYKTQSPGDFAYWTLGFLFLIGMHYLQPHPAGDGLRTSFNAFSWIPLSIAIGAGLFSIVRSSSLRTSSLTRGLVLSAAVLLLPLFYSSSADLIDLGRFYAIAAGLLLLVVLQQLNLSEKRQVLLLLFVLIAVWIEALLGWTQYALFGPENFMAFDPETQRPYGIFRQPNVMASFMATGLVFSIYLLVRSRQVFSGHSASSVLCLLTPLLIVPLLFQLNSRVGWLGASLGVLFALPYLYAQLGKRLTLSWLGIFTLGVVVALLQVNSADGWSLVASKLQSDPNRSFIYPQVIRMILEQPFMGVGYGNFEASYNLYAAQLYSAGITENAGYPNLHHPHNELLFWAAEGGVVALGGLLFAAYLVLRTILRAPQGHRLILVALFFPIVLHTQTEYPFYHSMVHFVVFVILIYLVDSIGNMQSESTLKSTLLFGTAGLVIPSVTTLFMVTTLHAGAILTKYEQVQGTSVASLLNIVNPIVWQERIRWELGSTAMFAGLAQGDMAPAYSFIEVIGESIQTKPRRESYQNLIFAYEFVGDSESADVVKREAMFRYPGTQFYDTNDGALAIMRYAGQTDE